VKDRVEHDGKVYDPDSLMELEDDQAAPLLGVGAVEAVTSAKDKKPKKDGDAAPPDPDGATAQDDSQK